MNSNVNINIQNLLVAKGILLQSEEICRNKISLISGAMTTPLIETIWIFSDHDTEIMKRILAFFAHLYKEGREAEMMAVLRILYDLSGLRFPEDVELLAEQLEARQYFLFSFMLDMEECINDLMSETGFE